MNKIFFCFLFCWYSKIYAQRLPNSIWSIEYSSSEEKKREYPNGDAKLIIDGNINTYWHSRWSENIAMPPHKIVVNLGAKALIKDIIITPRQNNSSGRCAEFEIKISDNGSTWQRVKKDVFYWTSKQDFSSKEIHFQTPLKAKYICIIHIKTFDNSTADNRVASLAELEINGSYIDSIVVPDFTISKPKDFYLVGEKIKVINATKKYLTGIKSLSWLARGAKIEENTDKSFNLVYQESGNYTLGLEVVDSANRKNKKILHENIRVFSAPAIDKRGIKILDFSDQDLSLNGFAANTLDENKLTRWLTTWDELKPLPHFLTYDLGENYRISGISYLPSQLIYDSGKVIDWAVYISEDGENWGKHVSKGSWNYKGLEVKDAVWPEVKGRYVKFYIYKTQPLGSNFANCADFQIYGVVSKELMPTANKNLIIYLLCLAILLIFVVLFILIRKKGGNKFVLKAEDNNEDGGKRYRTHIYLFGDFTILTDNQDFTSSFFPKVKQLLFLLIIKDRGVYVKELTDCLWPGMNAEKAKNNRGATIQHLKKAIATIPGVQLVYDKKKWTVNLADDVYCDYLAFNNILDSLIKEPSSKVLTDLKDILTRGTFLKNIDAEWLDNIKQDIYVKFINHTQKLLQQSHNDSLFIGQLAELVLLYDETNEIALSLLIKSLASQDKLSNAKSAYSIFIKRYKQVYNEDFSISFESYLKDISLK